MVEVNSVDLSDHVESVTYTTGTNRQNAAAMADVQDYGMPGTTFISPISIVFYADFASSKVYATVNALWVARTTFVLSVKPDSAADSATNPKFTVNVFVGVNPFVSGTRGDRHMATVVFEPAGALTIDTA